MGTYFHGKVVVITGGAGVLCRAMAKALAEQGAKIAILGLKAEKAERLAEEINRKGGFAIGLVANVLDPIGLEAARQQIFEKMGPCDILINGAGGNHPQATTTREYLSPEDLTAADGLKTFFNLDAAAMRFVFDLNITGSLLPVQVFGKDMMGRKGAAILNISSMNAFRPLTKIPAYSAAKAAVSNFTQWLAVHFSKAGIRVNAIAPGFFLTDQNRFLLTNEQGDLTDRGKLILSHTPMDRFGSPEDLVGAVLWLCGSASEFVTGIVVPVDGGYSAFSGV